MAKSNKPNINSKDYLLEIISESPEMLHPIFMEALAYVSIPQLNKFILHLWDMKILDNPANEPEEKD